MLKLKQKSWSVCQSVRSKFNCYSRVPELSFSVSCCSRYSRRAKGRVRGSAPTNWSAVGLSPAIFVERMLFFGKTKQRESWNNEYVSSPGFFVVFPAQIVKHRKWSFVNVLPLLIERLLSHIRRFFGGASTLCSPGWQRSLITVWKEEPILCMFSRTNVLLHAAQSDDVLYIRRYCLGSDRSLFHPVPRNPQGQGTFPASLGLCLKLNVSLWSRFPATAIMTYTLPQYHAFSVLVRSPFSCSLAVSPLVCVLPVSILSGFSSLFLSPLHHALISKPNQKTANCFHTVTDILKLNYRHFILFPLHFY